MHLIVVVMPRPTVLVAEPEPAEALSTRKLVLETGKFNVLTAHSTQEAIAIFKLFPNLNAAVLVEAGKVDAKQIGKTIKAAITKPPIIALNPRPGAKDEYADHTLSSHEPEALLQLLREMLGDPRQMDQ